MGKNTKGMNIRGKFRRLWQIKPITHIKESAKIYNRKKQKIKDKKEIDEYIKRRKMGKIKIKTLNSNKLELIKPIDATVEKLIDGKYFVSVSKELHWDWGIGKTKKKAIKDLCSSLEEFYFDLKKNENHLGKIMQKVWNFMQTIIKEKK